MEKFKRSIINFLKTFIFLTFIGFLAIPLSQCEKEVIKEFYRDSIIINTIEHDSIIIRADDSLGYTSTDFQKDSVYKANTDGFLSVRFSSNVVGLGYSIAIYSDRDPNPTTTIAILTFPGYITIPIQKNNYWKVVPSSQFYTELIIAWTPYE